MIGRAIKGAWHGLRQELARGHSGYTGQGGGSPLAGHGGVSAAGKTVTPTTAMSLSAVWSCVKGNGQVIGSLPLALYERGANGTRHKIDDELAEILTVSPSAGQTAMEYWESQAAQLMLQGNGYAERLYVGKRMVGLRPMFGVTPLRRDDGQFDYREAGAGRHDKMPPNKVFHLRGFGGGDGLGMSAIKHGTHSMGAALAADETAGRMFANGLMAVGAVETEAVLTPVQREQLRDMLATFAGSSRAGKVLTLEGGLKYNPLQLNPEDAQLLETRRFQVEDVCRWFGTPPIVIGHAGQGQTMWGTGVEAIMLAWLTLGINPMLRRMEARILKDLIPPERRGKWFAEWNREAMLQMDSKSKGEFLSKMTTGGVMTSDESRDKLNLPRRGGAADELRAQVATAPIDTLGKDKT